MSASDPHSSRPRLFSWWLCLLFLLVSAIYLWLISYGTFRLNVEEVRGVAFDSLGKSLLDGRADVQRDTINWEGFDFNGKRYIHYGPFPALLRIVPDLVAPQMYGKWSRPSCLAGGVLALLAFTLIAREALSRNNGLSLGARRLHLAVAILGFGLGTPLAYLVSCGRVYHEAVIWALCGGLFSLLFILRLALGTIGETTGLLLLSVSFAVTLLTRLTFALPVGLALALLFLKSLTRRLSGSGTPRARLLRALPLAAALAPAVLAVAVQLWYNHARFGSVFKSIDFAGNYLKPESFGGTLNLRRVPSALRNYFGLHGLLAPLPPYFELEKVAYADDSIFFGWKEHTFSLTFASVWLVLGALVGLLRLPFRNGVPWGRVLLVFYSIEAVMICAFYFVTQRYAAEFLPLLALLYAVFLIGHSPAWPLSRFLPWILLALALLSSAITIGSSLHWNMMYNGDGPQDYKDRLGKLLTPTVSLSPWSGREVLLSDLVPIAETFQYRAYKNDTTWEGAPLAFRGYRFLHGIGMHANATLTYKVPDGAVYFQAVIGLPDVVAQCKEASTVFELKNEQDRLLFQSGVVRNAKPPIPIRIALQGAKTLSLVVGDAGDGINCDHGSWAMAAFLMPGGK